MDTAGREDDGLDRKIARSFPMSVRVRPPIITMYKFTIDTFTPTLRSPVKVGTLLRDIASAISGLFAFPSSCRYKG